MKIGNYTLKELKERFKTPLYIYDEELIINNINTFKENFKSDLFNTQVIYAGKAFLTKYMAKLINQNNLYLDCVSTGELYTAKSVKFNFNNIVLHGNNKTLEELHYALDNNVGTIILDNLYEAEMLLNIKEFKYKPNVMLRVNLSFDVDTHVFVKTSISSSKFGVQIDNDSIKMIKRLLNEPHINFTGLHSHIGSQILEEHYFYEHIKIILNIYKDLKENHNINLTEINLGGGFGIRYVKEDKELNIKELLVNMIKLLEEEITKYELNINKVYIEPGRSIIGNAGYTLYTINQIKKTKETNFLFVDGSMNDNIRTSLYDAKYEALLIGGSNKKEVSYKVVGKACEEGDVIIKNIILNEALPGDLLLVKNTGAYHYSMASNYNRLPVPAVVFISGEEVKLVVKRETLEDLIKNDIDV